MASLYRNRGLTIIILTLILLSIYHVTAFAFGNTAIAEYDVVTGSNATLDSTYGPYYGSIWADNYTSNPGGQLLDADNWHIQWGQTQLSYLQADRSAVGPTFHVFSGQFGNCEAPFNSDGYWISNMPGSWGETKTADCTWDGAGDYYNEVRIKVDPHNLSAYSYYEGGAEFIDAAGLVYQNTGHVSSDIYTYSPVAYSAEKDHLPTWCFTPTSYPYHC